MVVSLVGIVLVFGMYKADDCCIFSVLHNQILVFQETFELWCVRLVFSPDTSGFTTLWVGSSIVSDALEMTQLYIFVCKIG